jgi:long-chain acyl-CoA synthetase
MDRIYKTAIDEVAHSPPLMRELFRISYERKRSRYEEGYNSFLLNRYVSKIVVAQTRIVI